MNKKLIIAIAILVLIAAVVALIFIVDANGNGDVPDKEQTAEGSSETNDPAKGTSTEKTPKVVETTDSEGKPVRVYEIPTSDGKTTKIEIRNDGTDETTVIEESKKPVESQQPVESQKPQESQKPAETQQPVESQKPQESQADLEKAAAEYEWFMALSAQEQEAYSKTFDPYEAFFDWFNASRNAYNTLHQGIPYGPGDYIVVD